MYDDVELETEAELEDLLYRDSSVIEPRMRVLSRQWNTDRGPLGMLPLDQDDRVVVAEFKLH